MKKKSTANKNPINNEKRDKRINTLLDSGMFTLQQLGDRYGLTRERIRQIGQRTYIERMARLKKEKNERYLKWLTETRYKCNACHTKVTNKEAKETHSFGLCRRCKIILKVQQRDPYTLLKCNNCKIKYHPFRVRRYQGNFKKNFHNMGCYMNYRLRMVGINERKYGDTKTLLKDFPETFKVNDFGKKYGYPTYNHYYSAYETIKLLIKEKVIKQVKYATYKMNRGE
jgi:hypothetical protein